MLYVKLVRTTRTTLAPKKFRVQLSIKDMYLNQLPLAKLKHLAKTLGLDELLRATESPSEKMVRIAMEEHVGAFTTVLRQIAQQKRAQEQSTDQQAGDVDQGDDAK